MNPKVRLPRNHRRALSVTAQAVEKTLGEMEQTLRSEGEWKVTSKISPIYSAEERYRLLNVIAEMRSVNKTMFIELGLQMSQLTEDRVVEAKKVQLWAILVDSKSKVLRGFGELPAELAQLVDYHISRLLDLVNQLR